MSKLRATPPLPALAAILLLAGCHGHDLPHPVTNQARAQQRAVVDTQRQQMELVPPPSKNRYMAVHSFESWENPYITVQPGMLELHITLADANTTGYGSGGMLRPVAARRQVVDIALDKLGEAVTSVPQNSWPYGRVIAIEEAHKTPPKAQLTVRRNMEGAIRTLNDLGIEVYDITEGSLR